MAHPVRPGDTIQYDQTLGGPPGHPTERVERSEPVLIQLVHEHDNGGLSIAYRYASNRRGVTWRDYIEPENVASVTVLESDPTADITVASLLPA